MRQVKVADSGASSIRLTILTCGCPSCEPFCTKYVNIARES